MLRLLTLNLLLFLASLAPAVAQTPAAPPTPAENEKKLLEPQPEHKLLASLAGSYDAALKIFTDPEKPAESIGRSRRDMILGGRFLKETLRAKMNGQDFDGVGITAFDPFQKKFSITWIDSRTPGFYITEGVYDAEKKTWTHFGVDYEPKTGKKLKSRDTLRIDSDDQQTLEMHRQSFEPDAKEFKTLEIVYTRKKE